MLTGRCHCGAISYAMPADVLHHALCHCSDCRRVAGAPMVSWAMLPGLVDVQSCTLDDPDSIPAQAHIQVADRIGWMRDVDALPSFERYPPTD